MSLYGALYSGVSGLKAESNRIGIFSDNISNANTVGYKQGSGVFETLVTSSGSVSYSPGGVLSKNHQQVSRQGLLQTTESPTDVAISGQGFFVVNSEPDGSGNVLYTRAGSFTQDNTGNFQNSGGFFLQGWPLDRDGRLPGATGNANTDASSSLSSLQTVNVQAVTGAASATTTISLSANLKASELTFAGQEGTVDMDPNTSFNYGISADDLIVPGGANSLARGDKMVVTTGSGNTYYYRYGGFSYSRDVITGSSGDSSSTVNSTPITFGTNPFTTTASSKVVSVSAVGHGLATGDVITLAGVSATVDGIPASELNQKFVITKTGADTFTVTMPTTAASAGLTGGGTGITAEVRPFVGSILDASIATQPFLGITGTSGFTTDALSFTITNDTAGTVAFTYTSSTPNAQLHQFNSLANLATSIDSVVGLTARVVNNRLYVGAEDANEAVLFENGSVVGTSGPPVKAGINWVGELGLANVGVGTNRFSTMDSLAASVNNSTGLKAAIVNPQANSSLIINVRDPLDTITFRDLPAALPLTAFTSSTPFATTNGSNRVTVSIPNASSISPALSTGDIVDFDVTGMTGYNLPVSAASNFTIGIGTTTMEITHAAHGFINGDVIHIDPSSMTGYPSATIGGVPLSDLDGNFTITYVDANTFEITVATTATSNATGGAGTFQAVPTFSGIPMTDFDGNFEISLTGTSTFTINVATAATATSAGVGAAGLVMTPQNNMGSIVAELGLVDSLDSAAYAPQTTGVLGPKYDPQDATRNMASGALTPQYPTTMRIYDSLGTAHSLRVGFIKISTNTWAAEMYVVPASEVLSTYANGLIGYGTLTFNGDGSLQTVTGNIANPLPIGWKSSDSDGDTQTAESSLISVNWGTAGALGTGKADGVSQFDSSYKVNFTSQNGVPVGELTGVTITADGLVVASYNNGETQSLYKIPIANFSDPDKLASISGNVFARTSESGEVNLREPGTGGTGKLQSSALEASNVDLAEQLTAMIVAQRAYQANTKTITTADNLLQDLNRILG